MCTFPVRYSPFFFLGASPIAIFPCLIPDFIFSESGVSSSVTVSSIKKTKIGGYHNRNLGSVQGPMGFKITSLFNLHVHPTWKHPNVDLLKKVQQRTVCLPSAIVGTFRLPSFSLLLPSLSTTRKNLPPLPSSLFNPGQRSSEYSTLDHPLARLLSVPRRRPVSTAPTKKRPLGLIGRSVKAIFQATTS